MKEKMALGTLVDWKEIKNLNRKACWSLRDVIAVFLRDYLYKFADEQKYGYPLKYADMEEWNEKIRQVADNFAIGISDITDEEYGVWCDPNISLEEKEKKINEIDNIKRKCIEEGFDGLKEIFWDLWD